MKKFRFILAFAARLTGFLLSFPTSVFYTISDLIKNDDDVFNF